MNCLGIPPLNVIPTGDSPLRTLGSTRIMDWAERAIRSGVPSGRDLNVKLSLFLQHNPSMLYPQKYKLLEVCIVIAVQLTRPQCTCMAQRVGLGVQ